MKILNLTDIFLFNKKRILYIKKILQEIYDQMVSSAGAPSSQLQHPSTVFRFSISLASMKPDEKESILAQATSMTRGDKTLEVTQTDNDVILNWTLKYDDFTRYGIK